ncbi:MAG TPA: WD40 repeat domain-containing protein [Caulobacteraceae bacterium]|jgi:WD40 repeat protein
MNFDAHVTEVVFDRSGRAAFALGDGSVRFEGGETAYAHDGAVLCAVAHPSGEGVVTGGDDGKVVWSRPDEAVVLATARGWVDAVAAAPATGLVAFASGRTASVLDAADPHFRRDFAHERSVAGLAFDPKGRRLACATYGGAALWFARIAEQKPHLLRWAGAHNLIAFSPDGRFLVSAMAENQLHTWRMQDAKDLRMGGYPAKIRSLSFGAGGAILATSGAHGAIVWPFTGANGPMGKEASEVGYDETSTTVRTAAAPAAPVIAAGTDDGRVWVANLKASGLERLKADKGPAVSALAISADGKRLAWGDEDGRAGVAEISV